MTTTTQPSELRLTLVERSLHEAGALIRLKAFDGAPPYDDAARGFAGEMKALKRKVDLLYLATTVGAFLLLGPMISGDVTILGVQVTISSLSKPTLTVILAGLYQQFLASLMSYVLAYGAFAGLFLGATATEDGWDYLGARYTAEMLWMNLIRVKKGGFVAPRSELLLSLLVHIPNGALVFGQMALVVAAIGMTLTVAIGADNLIGMAFSGIAMVGVVSAVAALFLALRLKLKFVPKT